MKKQLHLCFSAFLFLLFTVSCSGSDWVDNGGQNLKLTLDKYKIALKAGEETTLTALMSEDAEKLNYEWTVEDPSMLELSVVSKDVVKLKALKKGSTSVKVVSENKRLSATSIITIGEVVRPSSARILAIGNSFSQDAVEQHLYELAKEEGIELVIGNLYIGGCDLKRHWGNIENNKADYAYRKIVDGVKTNTPNTALEKALLEEDWDYISIQQASSFSGMLPTYDAHLPQIMKYLREKATNKDVKFILHQTWAYEQTSTHAGFANYNNDQMTMYKAIVEATKTAFAREKMDILIPVGTAIQNGRTSAIGDNFCRDKYHLELSYGQYTAAATWFEKIFEIDVRNNPYRGNLATTFQVQMAQEAAHHAVKSPFEVTELVDYKELPALKKNSYIDFGGTTYLSESPWNNVTGRVKGTTAFLVDEDGEGTRVVMEITDDFTGSNNYGTETPNVPTFSMPSTASVDVHYGNGEVWNSNQKNATAAVEFRGLEKDKTYDFTFFASRMNAKSGKTDSMEAKYTVTGTNSEILHLDALNNVTEAVSAKAIKPKEDGTVEVQFTYGDKNNHPSKFFYIGAIKLAPTN